VLTHVDSSQNNLTRLDAVHYRLGPMGDVQVTIRLPGEVLARVDKLVHAAAQSGNPLIARLSRSQMMRAIVQLGIERAEGHYAALVAASSQPAPKQGTKGTVPRR
jgi:hypothetical protein